MRSKEVEKSIKVIKRDITDYKEQLNIEIEFEDGIDEQQVAYLTQQITAYETLLNYISELEEETKEIEFDLTSVYMSGFYDGEKKYKDKIREKIKELETMAISQDIYYQDVLKLFEELLEGE